MHPYRPSPKTPRLAWPMRVKQFLVALGALGALTVGLAACPQAESAVVPGIVFAECVWTQYEAQPPGTSIATAIANILVSCGGDAANVVRVLNDREPAANHTGVAHAEKVPPAAAAPASSK